VGGVLDLWGTVCRMSLRRPRTQYADSGGVHIAYQVTGEENRVDLVSAPGSFSHLDMDWEWPSERDWIGRVSMFARLIRFDKRGTGLSDRPAGGPLDAQHLRQAGDARFGGVVGGATGMAGEPPDGAEVDDRAS
jgi:hypothetical protein